MGMSKVCVCVCVCVCELAIVHEGHTHPHAHPQERAHARTCNFPGARCIDKNVSGSRTYGTYGSSVSAMSTSDTMLDYTKPVYPVISARSGDQKGHHVPFLPLAMTQADQEAETDAL